MKACPKHYVKEINNIQVYLIAKNIYTNKSKTQITIYFIYLNKILTFTNDKNITASVHQYIVKFNKVQN